MKHIARKARVRFERHCGYWPAPKQMRFSWTVEARREPLPRGPEPLVPDSPEWWDAVQGKQGAGEPRSPVKAGGRALPTSRAEDGPERWESDSWPEAPSPLRQPSPGGRGTPPSGFIPHGYGVDSEDIK